VIMHPTDSLLNDYVDDALADGERVSVDDHLSGCEQCRAIVSDLRQLKLATDRLRLLEPPARVWTRIESTLDSRRSSVVSRQSPVASRPSPVASHQSSVVDRRSAVERSRLKTVDWRLSTTLWLATAAAALVLVAFVGLRVVDRGDATQSTTSAEPPSAQSIEAELQQGQEHYQNAIRRLELIAHADTAALDPRTAATLQTNLALVDVAIEESRSALRNEPNSEPAQASLLDGFKAKIALLQDTVELINETQTAGEAGEAPADSRLKRGI